MSDLGALEPFNPIDVGPPWSPIWKGGQAVVEVAVAYDGSATSKLVSTTDNLVAETALRDISRWRFAEHQPGALDITFVIKVAGDGARGVGKAKVEMDLPSRVTITVSPYLPIVEHAEPPGQPAPPPAVLVPAPHP